MIGGSCFLALEVCVHFQEQSFRGVMATLCHCGWRSHLSLPYFSPSLSLVAYSKREAILEFLLKKAEMSRQRNIRTRGEHQSHSQTAGWRQKMKSALQRSVLLASHGH